MASLTITIPEQDPVEHDLDGIERLTIGRGPENDLVLDHASISGSHAVIENTEGVIAVTDLGSTNGTLLNGEPISELVVLEHGSHLAFGHVEAIFEDLASSPAAGAVEPGDAGEGSGFGRHVAELAESSALPANFKDLSPVEKIVKKDTLAQVAYLLGVLALLAAATAGILASMMDAP